MKLLDAKSNYLTSKLNERFEISIVRAKLKTKRNIKRERQTNLYVEKKGERERKRKEIQKEETSWREGEGEQILKQKTTNKNITKFVFFLVGGERIYVGPIENHLRRREGIDTHGR